MRFTVLGSSGFVGRHLAEYLRDEGHDVICPKRTDLPKLNGFLGHVIYCIGLTADFREKPFETIEAHVCQLKNILQFNEFESFLYLSSTRVYREAPATNEDVALSINPNNPDDLYNISKAMGESLCLSQKQSTIRVARLSNVYGPDLESENFLNSVLEEINKTGKLTLRTALDSEKNYVSIGDVIKALTQISLNGTQRLYNVAGSANTSHKDITDKIHSIQGFELSVADKSPTVQFPHIDISRIQKDLEYSPRDVIDDLEQLFKHHKTRK